MPRKALLRNWLHGEADDLKELRYHVSLSRELLYKTKGIFKFKKSNTDTLTRAMQPRLSHSARLRLRSKQQVPLSGPLAFFLHRGWLSEIVWYTCPTNQHCKFQESVKELRASEMFWLLRHNDKRIMRALERAPRLSAPIRN
jgi:hypothetical protein